MSRSCSTNSTVAPPFANNSTRIPAGLLKTIDLTYKEIEAIKAPDLGLLYVMGVNGLILVSYAALRGFAWPDYIAALQNGLERLGPVRTGVYAETGSGSFSF